MLKSSPKILMSKNLKKFRACFAPSYLLSGYYFGQNKWMNDVPPPTSTIIYTNTYAKSKFDFGNIIQLSNDFVYNIYPVIYGVSTG